MSDIFESLENLPVSEECFDEIMGLVEGILSEDIKNIAKKHGISDLHTREQDPNKEHIRKKLNKLEQIKYDEQDQRALHYGKTNDASMDDGTIDRKDKGLDTKNAVGMAKTKKLQAEKLRAEGKSPRVKVGPSSFVGDSPKKWSPTIKSITRNLDIPYSRK